MDEVWELLSEDISEDIKKVFIKPSFPTRRWGQVTLKDATSDKANLQLAEKKLNERGIKTRIKFNKFYTEKMGNKYRMYQLEIFENL